MADYLDLTPDQLRELAKQHHKRAQDIRKQGEIPYEWLEEFPDGYGTIADPMHGALRDYYRHRHEKAERMADAHDRTHDQLIAAAKALEDGDGEGGKSITRSGGGSGPSGSPHGTPATAPDPTGARPEHSNEGSVREPVSTPADTSRLDDLGVPDRDSSPQPVAATDTHGSGPAVDNDVVPPVPGRGAMPTTVGPDNAGLGVDYQAGTGSEGYAAAPIPGATQAGIAPDSLGYPLAGMAPVFAPGPQLGSSEMPITQITQPTRPGMPFAAVAGVPHDRRSLPSMAVGEKSEDDLTLARTVLAAVLAAASDSAPGVEWAVGTIRARAGVIVLLTSTEGRGWLPAGLFLPSEIVLPWRWEFLFDDEERATIAEREGDTDPSRILVEFATLATRRGLGRISALVSSEEVSDGFRYTLSDTAIEGRVRPAEAAVDFSAPGAGLADRLTLLGSDELLRQAEAIPHSELRATCMRLARAGDSLVRRALPGNGGGLATRRDMRSRMLDALEAGRPVPPNWLAELNRNAERAGTVSVTGSVSASNISPLVGAWPTTSGEAVRHAAFERRADELLNLVAAGTQDRQKLRDVLYAYGQIAGHPQFPAVDLDTNIPTGITAGGRGSRFITPGHESAGADPIRPSGTRGTQPFAASTKAALAADGRGE
ncbi:type VII secretion target [Nocardia nova]|uniref:type VII secretion target n=1 Tax=Nocardia nova TaxID=37330 RepID=UPI003714B5F8